MSILEVEKLMDRIKNYKKDKIVYYLSMINLNRLYEILLDIFSEGGEERVDYESIVDDDTYFNSDNILIKERFSFGGNYLIRVIHTGSQYPNPTIYFFRNRKNDFAMLDLLKKEILNILEGRKKKFIEKFFS